MPKVLKFLALAGACVTVFLAALLVQQGGPKKEEPAEKPAAKGFQFEVAPYLQFGTRTRMTVCCETNAACSCEVLYGLTSPPTTSIKSKSAETFHELTLTNLLPSTKYFYQVTCTAADGTVLKGNASTFETAVNENEAFSFCVIGDTQRNPVATAKVAKVMWDRRPNFVVHMGDVVDDGAAGWQWTGDLFKPCAELFSRVPMFPTIGNHEKNHASYYKYFSLPKPEYYYTFRYGNIDFFSIDTNKDVGPTSEQYKWLEKQLADSTAKWTIVFHHHPLYSSDSDDYGDTNKTNSTYGALKHKPLIALVEKYKVDIVMNGHIHLYERTQPIRAGKVDPKGTIHITSGGGGGGLEQFEPTPSFFKNQGRSTYHCCYFTVVGGKLTGHVFDSDGQLFDQFEVKKAD
jgi:acid phosphatase type 7